MVAESSPQDLTPSLIAFHRKDRKKSPRLLIIDILGVNRARVRRDIKSDISDAIGRLDIH
ncbi:hypothetical protein Ct61P_15191 [Colletotrichum tofieldiae]|nr:hypothetical protein Ct61P_15191 [Colletotrichum tofieldiae]